MWTWQALGAAGSPHHDDEVAAQAFPTQSDAETWLGQEWPGLLARGISAVSLFEEGRLVYGPMSLHPPA